MPARLTMPLPPAALAAHLLGERAQLVPALPPDTWLIRLAGTTVGTVERSRTSGRWGYASRYVVFSPAGAVTTTTWTITCTSPENALIYFRTDLDQAVGGRRRAG